MKIGLLIGLVVVIHHASSFKIGCGCGCGPAIGHSHSCGCGIPFPNREKCSGSHLIHQGDDWCSNGPNGNGRDCVPLVVRPHDMPKVELSPEAAEQLSKPVPNPCAIKKAIVKPAVLPKPVCRHHHHHGSSSCSCHSSCDCHHSCHSVHGVLLHGHGHHGHHGHHGPHGFHGPHCHGPHGIVGPAGFVGPAGAVGPNGPLAPADPVSLDIALKLARKYDNAKCQSEDRLNFGFRKIPIELPPKKFAAKNIPEEQIFKLNGQIVELKPVRPPCAQGPASLAEEAAEQLIALEEEEAAALAEQDANGPFRGPRRPTLGEIGFCAAKLPNPNLVDVPCSPAAGPGPVDSCELKHKDISTNCGCGHYSSHYHGCGCHSHHSCGCEEKCKCKIIPGNVEYKTVPKPKQICLPVPQPQDSCESAEIELSQEEGPKVHCSCIPVCVKKCHHNCKKTCVTVEKFNC